MAATRALGGVRPVNRALLEKLVVAAGDKSANVREVAIASLVSAGADADFAKDTILKATEDADPKVRVAATKSLATFKFNEDQMQAGLERGLRDESAEVRARHIENAERFAKVAQVTLAAASCSGRRCGCKRSNYGYSNTREARQKTIR